MDADPQASLGFRIFSWIGWCLLALLLYVGSIGPVILVYGGKKPSTALQTFYAPVVWAARNTALDVPIGAYARWWDKWQK